MATGGESAKLDVSSPTTSINTKNLANSTIAKFHQVHQAGGIPFLVSDVTHHVSNEDFKSDQVVQETPFHE